MFTIPRDVTAISIDIWNTLLRGNPAFTRPRLGLIFDLLGHEDYDIEKVVEAYRHADRTLDRESERTGLDYDMPDRLVIMYRLLKIDRALPGDAAIKNIQAQTGKLRLEPRYMPSLVEPTSPATLEKLRSRGIFLGLLSNTGMDNGSTMVPVLQALGIWEHFHAAIFSSDVGLAKPNGSLFRTMAAKLRSETEHTMHIGDNEVADFQAHLAGLHAYVYAPDGSNFPHIRSLEELLGH